VTAYELRIGIESPIPDTIAIGKGNAVYLHGWCYHATQRISVLEIAAGSVSRPVQVYGTVRSDVFRVHHPRIDPSGNSFRSGFWGVLPLTEGLKPGPLEICLRATLESGEVCVTSIGTPVLSGTFATSPVKLSEAAAGRPLVSVCLATCNPQRMLFKRQIESLIAQSYTNWVCIISDDGSRPEVYSEICEATREDPRFRIFRRRERAGFYRNFEHCLSFVPVEASFVALCDHDDIWHPDKLASLLAAFDAQTTLAYSDMRIVETGGKVRSATYWTTRVNNYKNFASLLIANTVTGAASLFRRELLDVALPFPELPGEPYHDHWIACVALATGKLAYIDRPLYDYVQHGRNVIGHYSPGKDSLLRNVWAGVRNLAVFSHTMALWRNIYFGDVLRIELIASIVEQRCRSVLSGRNRSTLLLLNRMDERLLPFVWLVVRRVREIWRGNETVAAETRLLRGILWRRCAVLRSKFGPGPPLRHEPAAEGIMDNVAVIRQKIAPLKLAVEPDAIRRVNLLIPTIDFDYLFGGYIAKFCLAKKLAEAGFHVRIVIVDFCDYKSAFWRQQLQSFQGIGGVLDSCQLAYAFDRNVALEVSSRDSFVATTWWTAYIARRAALEIGGEEFLYLIQEYEPFTFPMGTFASLARETYRWPHRALFSTELLKEYFRQERLGVFAGSNGDDERRFAVFRNAITNVGPVCLDTIRARPSRRLLFYARPEPHAARNMFELGILALCSAIEAGVFDDRWEFTGIGSVGPSCTVALTKGRHMRLLQRQSQGEYKKVLMAHDLGLALMCTPHPSLVPIEMASAGMVVVTSTFENKTVESLRRISPNFVAVEPTVERTAGALREAISRLEDFDGRVAGAAVNWCRDWDSAFPEDLLKRVGELLEAVSPES
jgi:glycosyltransferase involved in cell wall biosynthesis